MRDKTEMYDYAARYRLVGIPTLMFPLSWLGKMDFSVIAKNILDGEEILFTFMAIANPEDFDDRGNSQMMQDSQMQSKQSAGKREWLAFALSDRGNLYYGHWRLYNSDIGNIPIRSTQDIITNTNEHFLPYTSRLDIDFRNINKTMPNLGQTRDNVRFIRNQIDNTIQSLGKHATSEDGRRIYNQTLSNDDGENLDN